MEIENLKCCGNCIHRERLDLGEGYLEECTMRYNTGSNEICSKYKFDNLIKKHRKINRMDKRIII